MGILWADGHLSETSVVLEIDKVDLDEIKSVFFKLGEWGYSSRIRKGRIKEVASIICCNKEILNVFDSYQYKNKSLVYPIVLKGIPDELKKYFFRGLIDGDGNFYISKTQNQFSLAGSYEQDWSYFEDLLKMMQIKYAIKKTIVIKNGKTYKSSVVRVTKRKDIIKLGEYIYNGFEEEKIGFDRKYKKILIMKQAQYMKCKKLCSQ